MRTLSLRNKKFLIFHQTIFLFLGLHVLKLLIALQKNLEIQNAVSKNKLILKEIFYVGFVLRVRDGEEMSPYEKTVGGEKYLYLSINYRA